MKLTIINDKRLSSSRKDSLLELVREDKNLTAGSRNFINGLIINDLTQEVSREQIADRLNLSETRVSNLLKILKTKEYCKIEYKQSKKLTIKFQYINTIRPYYGGIVDSLFTNTSPHSKFLLDNFIFNNKSIENISHSLPNSIDTVSYSYIYKYCNRELFNTNMIIKKLYRVNSRESLSLQSLQERFNNLKEKREKFSTDRIASEVYGVATEYLNSLQIERSSERRLTRYLERALFQAEQKKLLLRPIESTRKLLLAVQFGLVRINGICFHVDLRTIESSLKCPKRFNWLDSLGRALQVNKLKTILQ